MPNTFFFVSHTHTVESIKDLFGCLYTPRARNAYNDGNNSRIYILYIVSLVSSVE